MKKFVYLNKGQVVVLDKKVEGAEFASIVDLKNEIEKINNGLLSKWGYGDSPLGFDDIMGIDLSIHLVLKEDTYYWNREIKDYESIEAIQLFDNPKSWTDEEMSEFAEILLSWIMCNDHTYDLFKFIKEINEGCEHAPYARDKFTEKFERLFKKELDINHHMLEHYENHYENDKKEYEQYKKFRENEDLLSAKVEGGVN